MSMSTALSGLMAAQTEISATSNNIANVGTMGFRGSRVEFSDVFSTSPFSASRTAVGTGVQVQRVVQDFSQGNVVTTGNLLDIAIEGQGFFALQQLATENAVRGGAIYSRSGAFALNKDGFVADSGNRALLAWPVSMDGKPLTEDLNRAEPLKIPMQRGEPVPTARINLETTLPSGAAMLGQQDAVPPTKAFDAADPTTFAHHTVVPAFDANGKGMEADVYFIRTASPSATSADTSYQMRLFVDGVERAAPTPTTVTFGADGRLSAGAVSTFGTAPDAMELDLSSSTVAAAPFAVQSAAHDGKSREQLTNLDIDTLGGVWATYGTGQRVALGQVVLANFSNPQGLRSLGKSTFAATAESGPVQTGLPGSAGFGALRSGALERSNVELTEELVNLISAQRNYQASAKAMETSTSLMQTIMNIRT
ncbi:MAG: flagellar biosynthesis protein FlgE [Rhodobacteraceae bacterium PARR1]|nr:MAG: flagellar biosynthesis protein FlgE [Rhodobacteraceae bacterium PARR1]